MSKDRASEPPISSGLPEPVDEWLTERAAEQGVSEEELLANLLATIDGADVDLDVGAIEESLEALRRAVSELESDFDEKIRDVRERVIQVKREADAKAPEDHDHPELERELARVAEEVDAVESTLEELDDRIVRGFDNYEAVLEHLVSTTADIEHKLDILAETAIDLREGIDALSEDRARRQVVAELSREANRHGARRAECAACSEMVDIGLLSEPQCPHCAEGFSGFRPREGLFGSNVLETESVPALEPGEDDGDDLDDAFEFGGDFPDGEGAADEDNEAEPDGEDVPDDIQSLFGK